MSDEINYAVEYDGITGEVKQRELTSEEIENREVWRIAIEKEQAEANAKAAARESALAKLAELGLTAEEIAAL